MKGDAWGTQGNFEKAYYSHKMFAEESLCELLKMNTFPNIKGEPNASTVSEGAQDSAEIPSAD